MNIKKVINQIKFPIRQCYITDYKDMPCTEYTRNRLKSWDDIYDALEVTDREKTIIDFDLSEKQKSHIEVIYLIIGTSEDILLYKSNDIPYEEISMVLYFFTYGMPFENRGMINKEWNIRHVRYDR